MQHPIIRSLLIVLLGLAACQPKAPLQEEAPITPMVEAFATPEDFAEAKQVNPQVTEGFQLDLWAPGPLLSNAVALSIDNQGVAYVAETSRRKSSDIDIRAHREWMVEDISLQSLEDTRDFHLKKLATPLSAENTWQEDFNGDSIHDYRDLSVQSERIRRIVDSDEDGKADYSNLFAEGFNEMLTGVAAGVLHHDGQVYLTAAPKVYRLEDSNQDGQADKRKVLSEGYGIHIAFAGHDMSGLTIGMDGKVYWSIGDIGVNVVDEHGKRWAYPNQGCIMRCNPDGSEFEVYAHGVRNPQELAFDNYGNLISVDNDGDHRGEHERYIHIIEGSDTGWRINWQYGKYNQPNEDYKVWMDEKLHVPYFPGQAAYIIPTLKLAYNGPAGIAFNPGTALSSKWNNYFFASYFTGSSARSRIQAFQIQPKGASFKIQEEKDIISGGVVPTGITFGPEGSLYINDWKDSYDKKPEGRIWKLDVENSDQLALRLDVKRLLKAGFKATTTDSLRYFLGHPDQRIRMGAQFELVNRNEAETLLQAAKTNSRLLTRLHAIWGIGQLARKDASAAAPTVQFLADNEAEVRAQTAKILGDANYTAAFNQLLPLLKDTSPRVQFFAAEALGKLGNPAAFQSLVELLEKIEDQDPHLRHAIVYALSRLNLPTRLASLADHPSKFVRIGAVVALRTLRAPEVAVFMKDRDEWVVTETARAINDDFSIPEALPALAEGILRNDIQNEAFLRRAINANLRLGDLKSAYRLVDFSLLETAPLAMREDALWALGYWSSPPVLDRVDNRYRELKGHDLEAACSAFALAFPYLIKDSKTSIQLSTIKAAGRLAYAEAGPELFNRFKADKNPEIRIAALEALTQINSKNLSTALDIALVDTNKELRQKAQILLENASLPESKRVAMYTQILEEQTLSEKQQALKSLAKLQTPQVGILLQDLLNKVKQSQIEPALQLDVLSAIEQSSFEEIKKTKAAYEETLASQDILAQYTMAMYGGDVEKGKRIFARDESAQCLRCHAIQGYGGAVGPPMDNIGGQLSPEELLLSLVAPNNRIAPGYGTVILKLQDGKEIVGTLLEESSESIVLKSGDKEPQTIPRGSIQEQETLPSGMFNMSEILTKTQIRDLMAFLMTLKEI